MDALERAIQDSIALAEESIVPVQASHLYRQMLLDRGASSPETPPRRDAGNTSTEKKKPVTRTRSKQINIRLTPQEYDKLLKIQQYTGWNRTQVIQSFIMKQKLKERSSVEWPELLRQISAIGNNINQIARIANANRHVNPDEWEQVRELQTLIWKKMMDL
ncbi:MobC family plasmid mobilization relaxosome protein [Ruminococcaceae bacterium OttesenSCG-928-L11]|nr:MobC family plasmid mobilization relaxosome protein [Ruminococcaceae bacterium OttesenSCG-928-L11]